MKLTAIRAAALARVAAGEVIQSSGPMSPFKWFDTMGNRLPSGPYNWLTDEGLICRGEALRVAIYGSRYRMTLATTNEKGENE